MWTQIKLWIFSKPQKSPNIPLLWLIWGNAVSFLVTVLALLHSSSPLGKVSYPQLQTCPTSFLTAPNPQESLASLKVKVTQSCPTLCDPMDHIVHGILQARILEWVAFPFSRGSSQPRNQTRVSCIADGFFTNWAIREASLTPLLNFYAKSFLIST